jgi:hypothetical protein
MLQCSRFKEVKSKDTCYLELDYIAKENNSVTTTIVVTRTIES